MASPTELGRKVSPDSRGCRTRGTSLGGTRRNRGTVVRVKIQTKGKGATFASEGLPSPVRCRSAHVEDERKTGGRVRLEPVGRGSGPLAPEDGSRTQERNR